ncbi:MAG TPA: hypothetical protein VNA20_16165 [Frankiaceae bacterium]|nr:hypothetical protein [Frankiaceae bacterium]
MLVRRRTLATLAALALAAPLTAGPASGDPKPGGFMSANVTWQGTVPLDVPGIGAKVVQVGKQKRFYVTGLRGLTIYDVTLPMVPIPLGHLELPHFENESVSVAADGSLVLISSDFTPQTFVIDTSLVHAPQIASIIPDGSHTVACSDARCSYVYASQGWAYDLRERETPKPVRNWGGGGHAASLDAAGFVINDGGLEVFDPRRDGSKPKKLTRAATGGKQVSYGHNNIRPDATKWRPRRKGDNSPALRSGELLLSGGETLITGDCPGGSGITSWSMANFDRGAPIRPLDTFYPKKGNWVDGNPMANVAGCSSHWFDYRKGVVTAGWYENGIRFFDIHRTTGKITEVGWFQPVATEAWAAYWIDDEYVYTLDGVRGIDILRFDRKAKPPAQQESDRSWRLDPNLTISFVSQRERQLCRLAQQA